MLDKYYTIVVGTGQYTKYVYTWHSRDFGAQISFSEHAKEATQFNSEEEVIQVLKSLPTMLGEPFLDQTAITVLVHEVKTHNITLESNTDEPV